MEKTATNTEILRVRLTPEEKDFLGQIGRWQPRHRAHRHLGERVLPGYGPAIHRLISRAMEIDRALAGPIRTYLEAFDSTPKELAELSGVQESTIVDIVTHRTTSPDRKTIEKIRRIIGEEA